VGQAMPGSTGPLIPRRRLGATFRRLREEKGEQLKDTAKNLMFSSSKLSRIETGVLEPQPRDLRDLLAYYGETDTALGDALRRWADDVRAPTWWTELGFRMQSRLSNFIAYETAAAVIRSHETTVVPGWVQTHDYARAVIERLAPHLSPGEARAQADLRVERQQRLDARAEPPTYVLAIPEPALRWQVGNSAVMRAQLEFLLERSEDPRLEIHVIPFAAGPYKAIEGGFTIFEFADPLDSSIVAVESVSSLNFLDDRDAVDTHTEYFEEISNRWLSASSSRAFIRRLLEEDAH
jgi:transcriptional regulator with XRE-family HTH domain